MRHGLDQPQGDLGGDARVVGGVQHLVAEGLDQPSAVRGHQVGGRGLEGLDQLAELLLLHPAGEPGEPDQVREADGETPVDHLLVVGGLHDPSGRGGELTPPDIDQELLQLGQEQLDDRVRHLGARHARLGRLGQPFQEGVDLPLGEPGGGLPGGPGHLYGHRLAQQPRLDETGEAPQGEYVRLGEGLGLPDVREAHRPPEAGGQFHGDTGAAGRLKRGVPALGPQNEPFEAQGERVLAGVGALRVRTGIRVFDGHACCPSDLSRSCIDRPQLYGRCAPAHSVRASQVVRYPAFAWHSALPHRPQGAPT